MNIAQERVILIYGLNIFSGFLLFPLLVESDIRSPDPFIRNVGQDAVFTWNSTNGHRIFEVRWGLLTEGLVKPQFVYVDMSNNPILSSALDGSASNYKRRVKWVGDLSAGHVWFKLTNLTLNDTNKYVAEILEEGKSSITYSTKLTVAVIPKFNPKLPPTKNIAEGHALSLPCTAIGPPTPNITWVQIVGHVIKSTGTGSATLRIPNIRRDQNGMYECQAWNNPNEKPVTAQTMVNVHYKPAIGAESSSRIKSWNGNSIRLKCFASGVPSPGILWYKPANQHITTGVNIVPGGSEVTVLTTTDQGDYGQYTCRATNSVGNDEHTINVTQLFPPGSSDLKITEIEASFITVIWTKPANDGGSHVTGYLLEINSNRLIKTVNTNATITRLKKNSKYTLNLYAINKVGYGRASTKVAKTKKSGKPTSPDLIVMLLNNTKFKLSVTLKWKKPDDNGGIITKYTIYMKEVKSPEWEKIDDVTVSNQLEFTITKDIVYGNTYIFTVTAWNKYGESIRDDNSAKTVNTTADTAAYRSDKSVDRCTEENSIYGRKETPPNQRKITTKANVEMYDNDLELDDKTTPAATTSLPQNPLQTGPEYESIKEQNDKSISIHGEPRTTGDDPSHYQGLDLPPNISTLKGPVYEALRTRSVESKTHHNENEQHPYEPISLGDMKTDYQSLHSKNRESFI